MKALLLCQVQQFQGIIEFISVESTNKIFMMGEQIDTLMGELQNRDITIGIHESINTALQKSGFHLSKTLRSKVEKLETIDEKYQTELESLRVVHVLEKQELQDTLSVAELKANSVTALVTQLQTENTLFSPELERLQIELRNALSEGERWETAAQDFAQQVHDLTESKRVGEEQVCKCQI